MYRNSQFALFSEMSKYVYMLVGYRLLFVTYAALSRYFQAVFNVLPGQTWNLCLFHASPLRNDNTDLVSRKRARKTNGINIYICLAHHPQSLPMDVHETLLKLIVAVSDRHYHIIHAQGSVYLIECA